MMPSQQPPQHIAPYVWGLSGLGDTTVTVGSQSITVDAEGNWVAPWYCTDFALLFPSSCTAPSAATLNQANNLANIGGSASSQSSAAAQTAMNATDSAAAAQDPCYLSDYPLLCALTGGLVGGNGTGTGAAGSSGYCYVGSSLTDDNGNTCCALGGICMTTWGLIALGTVGAILAFSLIGSAKGAL